MTIMFQKGQKINSKCNKYVKYMKLQIGINCMRKKKTQSRIKVDSKYQEEIEQEDIVYTLPCFLQW